MVAEQTNEARDGLSVFLSYSRKDQQSAVWLREELEGRGVEVFRDVDDTLPGEVWWQRLQDLIAKSDAVIFVLSSNSVASSVCGDEVVHAHNLSKRIFPVAISDVDWEAVPERLSRVHSVSFVDTEARAVAMQQLCEALSTNIDWVREHTRLYERALRWEQRGRSRHELLRARVLNDAEVWLDTQPQNAEPPTLLHREFFQASRDAARQRRALLTSGLIAGFLLAVTLAGFAFWQRSEAQIATGKAKTAQTEAERQEGLATDAKIEAERQAGLATDAKIEAQASEQKTRRTLATSLVVRASRRIADQNTADALAFLSRAVEVDPDYRSARVRLHSLLTTRRFAVPLISFSISQQNILAPPQFHSEKPHFYDGERTWNLDSLDLVSNAIDLSWARHRTVLKGERESPLVLMPAMPITRDPNTLLLTDSSQGVQAPLQVFRHEGSVTYFEFSHGGDRVVSSSADGSARVWMTESGEPVGGPIQHRLSVNMATFSPDDGRVLTTSADRTASLWNSTTGEQIGAALTHEGDVLGGNFSADGSRVITWTSEPVVCVWDPANSSGGPFAWFRGFPGKIQDARLSRDGELLAVALTDGTARVFDIGDARQFRVHCEPIPHGSPVRWVSFATDGNRLATAGSDAVTRLWQLPSRSQRPDATSRETLIAGSGTEFDVNRDDPDSDVLIDTSNGETVARFESLPPTMAISPSGRYLLDPLDLQVFDTSSGTAIQFDLAEESAMLRRMGAGRAFEFSPDESRLLTLHRDHVARVWKLPSGKHLADIAVDASLKLPGGGGAPSSINIGLKSACWKPDGSQVVIVGRHIGVYDAASGERSLRLASNPQQSFSDMPACVTIAPSGKLIAGGYTAVPVGRFQIWDATTGEATGFPVTHGDMVVALAFTRDASRIVVGAGNGLVRVYDVATREPLTDVMQAGRPLKDVSFSIDENLVVVATAQTVQVWDVATSQPVTDKMPVRRRPIRVRPTPDDAHIRVEYDNGSSEKIAIDWPPSLPRNQVAKHAELATALAGRSLVADTNIMQPLDAFEVLLRLQDDLSDAPSLSGLDLPHWKAWSLSDWIDSCPTPESLQELKLLSLRFPPVPLSQARLAVMWVTIHGATPDEESLSKVMGQRYAEMAQLGQNADPRAYSYLSQYYQLTGDPDRARSMAELALQHDPSSDRFLKQLQSISEIPSEDEARSEVQEPAP